MKKGSKHTLETRGKISKNRKSIGWKWTPEYREKVMKSRKAVLKTGAEHHLWKGGRQINPDGYVLIRISKDEDTRYAMEHRLVMEKHIGRKLKATEQVHHRNGIKTDNRIENLEIVSYMQHFGEVTCPHCKKLFKVK